MVDNHGPLIQADQRPEVVFNVGVEPLGLLIPG